MNKNEMQLQRMEQLGMDQVKGRHSFMNSFKNLDCMGEHDIFHDARDLHQPGHKRYQKQRAQLLPLGGMLGERVAKSMSIYGQNYNPTAEMPGKHRKSKAHKLAELSASQPQKRESLEEQV